MGWVLYVEDKRSRVKGKEGGARQRRRRKKEEEEEEMIRPNKR